MADQVPPLEDVPEVLERVQNAEQMKRTAKENKEVSLPEVPTKKASLLQASAQKSSSSNFGGMKKGFLFGGPTKGKKSLSTRTSNKSSGAATQSAENIPMIRARPENSSLVFKEVQNAMDANNAMEFQDKLAKKLETNAHVRDVLSDPAWIPILDEFQRDPEAAMKKYRKDVEVTSTLKELCNVLGDTFLHMNSSIKSEEELLSSKLMENPQVKEALMDPLVQQMMVSMKQGANDKVQRCFQSANPSQKRHIQTLIDVGLFSFAM
ncbi:uncharacterized protein LOC121879973 [Homarus americanus]|uniref:Putative STI1 domain-containing protein n=1 Tax=Homarus americanus TaxID=6706 RepID=A0A8J5JG68_HOMAM|nr:uncharacterized protein LOC121879973 [Homarus americanus]KAG7157572.1 putative STI1 domain-containing protein [Homarus americanus]